MPGAKPWFNDEWTEERVERGKRLAADASSPDHAGTDLQVPPPPPLPLPTAERPLCRPSIACGH